MIEESVFTTLVGAAGEGQIERLVGAILVSIVALVRYVTQDRFSLEVGSWISAVSALCGGVGAALLAGAVWWHALMIGLVVAPSSKGFWGRVRSLLPKRKGLPPSIPPTATLMALLGLVAILGSGCAVRKAQAGVQTALTTTAEAVAAADAIVAEGIPDAADQARAEIQERIDGGEVIRDPLEEYRRTMQSWYRASDGLEVTRVALTAAQAGLTIWIGTGDLPDDWGELCDGVATAVAALTGMLEALGVDVPRQIEQAQGLISPACQMVANAF